MQGWRATAGGLPPRGPPGWPGFAPGRLTGRGQSGRRDLPDGRRDCPRLSARPGDRSPLAASAGWAVGLLASWSAGPADQHIATDGMAGVNQRAAVKVNGTDRRDDRLAGGAGSLILGILWPARGVSVCGSRAAGVRVPPLSGGPHDNLWHRPLGRPAWLRAFPRPRRLLPLVLAPLLAIDCGIRLACPVVPAMLLGPGEDQSAGHRSVAYHRPSSGW